MRRMKGSPRRRPRPSGLSVLLRRLALWAGVPVLLAGGLYGAFQLSRSSLGQWAMGYAADRMLDGTARLGLVVTDVKVEGRETTDRETILAALGAGPGTPILAMSPRRAKEQLKALPWVRSAVVERRLPDTLYVRLVERKPLALWQHGGKLELIDREGGVIPVTRLDRFAKLPLVVGEGAARHAADLLDMLTRSPSSPLASVPRSGLATAAGTCASTTQSMSSSRPTRRPAPGLSSPGSSDRAPS